MQKYNGFKISVDLFLDFFENPIKKYTKIVCVTGKVFNAVIVYNTWHVEAKYEILQFVDVHFRITTTYKT